MQGRRIFRRRDGNCAAYREYDISAPNPGWAVLDSTDVWEKVKEVIREAAGDAAAANTMTR